MRTTIYRLARSKGALLFAFLAVAVLVPASSGFAAKKSSPPKPIAGGTVVVRENATAFGSLDIQTNRAPGAAAIQPTAYATLVALSPKYKVIPYLAKSWKVTPTSVTFTLKKGPTCADGSRLNPAMVKASFARMLALKPPYLSNNFGPGPYSLSTNNKKDTFTFRVGTPFSDLIFGFVNFGQGLATGIICPAGIRNPASLQTQAFGLGPYKLVSRVEGDHETFKLRSDFNWGPKGTTAKTLGLPKTLVYKIVTNETTAANLLLTNGLDVAQVTGPDVDRLRASKQLLNTQLPQTASQILQYNMLPGHPTDSEIVRRALSTAIDPRAWNVAASGRHGIITHSFLTPADACYDPKVSKLAPKDPSYLVARKLLTSAGWKYSNGKLEKSGQPLTINLAGMTLYNSGPEYVLQQWTKMGAQVSLVNYDPGTYVTKVIFGGNFDASFSYFDNNIPTQAYAPVRFTGSPYPQSLNYARTVDAKANAFAQKAAATVGATSCHAYDALQERIWKAWDVLPLAAPYDESFSRSIEMPLGATDPVLFRRVKVK